MLSSCRIKWLRQVDPRFKGTCGDEDQMVKKIQRMGTKGMVGWSRRNKLTIKEVVIE